MEKNFGRGKLGEFRFKGWLDAAGCAATCATFDITKNVGEKERMKGPISFVGTMAMTMTMRNNPSNYIHIENAENRWELEPLKVPMK